MWNVALELPPSRSLDDFRDENGDYAPLREYLADDAGNSWNGARPSAVPLRRLKGVFGNWIARWLDSRRAVHFIVALAVILRCAVLGLLAHQPLAGDATYYHDFALRLLQGKTIYPFVPPSVGFYLAFVYRLLGTSPVVARASMMPLAIGSLGYA